MSVIGRETNKLCEREMVKTREKKEEERDLSCMQHACIIGSILLGIFLCAESCIFWHESPSLIQGQNCESDDVKCIVCEHQLQMSYLSFSIESALILMSKI